MPVYQIDPLVDRRWSEFVAAHPRASAFHSRGWLDALRRTYGFQPMAFTTSPGDSDLSNAVVFCRVESWLTGSRLVSLPFADHCEPLTDNSEDLNEILQSVTRQIDRLRVRYVELRPLHPDRSVLREGSGYRNGDTFRFHTLDLRGSLDAIFHGCHKDSVQRRIRRSANAGLNWEEGSNPELLRKFYSLLILTRRRHQLLPQPFRWFKNLAETMGQTLNICVASRGSTPLAGILTLHHNGLTIYKYGCSDARFNKLGATPGLLWRAIEQAKTSGAHTFDMGRSDVDNLGLIAFKCNWGTVNQELTYWQYPGQKGERSSLLSRWQKIGGRVVSHLPSRILTSAGEVLYKHAG